MIEPARRNRRRQNHRGETGADADHDAPQDDELPQLRHRQRSQQARRDQRQGGDDDAANAEAIHERGGERAEQAVQHDAQCQRRGDLRIAPAELVLKGQESAKRALEVAAAGGHNLLMVGPPGAGKSMLAARLPSILPPLAPAELLEVSMVASVAGEIKGGALTNRRPFRAPHHSASMPALVGGGLHARPGEISLAHQGVLFLDELPEFQPQALDSLRQPLETGEVSIARANHRVTYPARFMLVAAMNPCRCGRADEPGFACRRGPNTRCSADYQARISGPLLDRIDLHIEVPAVTAADLILPPPAEGSREIAERVALGPRAAGGALCRDRPAARPQQCRGRRRGAGRRGAAGRAADLRCCAKPPTRCGSPRAAITACCASRARSPISTASTKSAACIWRRRCPTGRWRTRSGGRRKPHPAPLP